MSRVTFVLPHRGSAGAIRVTVDLATELMNRGHQVRIAYRTEGQFSRTSVIAGAKRLLRSLQGSGTFDWLDTYQGSVERFQDLRELTFADGEIAIAVAQDTVRDVYLLPAEVHKLRYCHGFHDHLPEPNELASGDAIPTISVSNGLLPRVRQLRGVQVLGVVPNGIKRSDYYLESRMRDGIGMIFHEIPIKGPQVAKAIIAATKERHPEVPWHMFGTSRRPGEFQRSEYHQYPSISKGREVYNRCKIWLVTSRDEGFCLPILEAMACGCAVITSNHTAAGDLIDNGVNGFIVPYGEVDAYLEKIQLLLNSEPLRQQIVSRGLSTAAQFTWERAAERMEEVFDQLVRDTVQTNELAPTL